MFKKMKGLLSAVLVMSLLAGCSLPGLGGKDNANDAPQTLKVLFYDESYFYQEYGMLYSALHENVDIEVISMNNLYSQVNEDETYEDLYIKLIEEKQPDVIITEGYLMGKLLEKNLLYDLDSFVNQESYDLAGLGTSVIDYMKEIGNGVMYGIPTSIYSYALYYNKDVFDEYGVPYPTDNMTWSEVYSLAQRFPTEGEYPDRVYGLKYGYSSNLSDLINQMSNAQGLQQYDTDTLKMTMDTPAWHDLVENAVKLYKSGTLYSDELRWNQPIDYSNYDQSSLEPILGGIVAMAYESSYYLRQLKQEKNYAQNPDDLTDNWDLVSSPLSTNGSNASSNTSYGNVMAINSKSTNVETAWDFVSYVTGDEFARVKSFASYGNLPVRMKYALKDETKNVQALYMSKPLTDFSMYDFNAKIPQKFNHEFYQVLYEEFQKLQDGNVTVAEALATLQLKGDELLASGYMTDEEFAEYQNELYGNMDYGMKNFVEEAAGVTEEVEVEVVE